MEKIYIYFRWAGCVGGIALLILGTWGCGEGLSPAVTYGVRVKGDLYDGPLEHRSGCIVNKEGITVYDGYVKIEEKGLSDITCSTLYGTKKVNEVNGEKIDVFSDYVRTGMLKYDLKAGRSYIITMSSGGVKVFDSPIGVGGKELFPTIKNEENKLYWLKGKE